MFVNRFLKMPPCLYPFSPEALEKAKTRQGHFTFVLAKIDLLVSLSLRPVPPLILPVSLKKIPSFSFVLKHGVALQLSSSIPTTANQSINHQVLSIPPAKDLPIHPSIHPSIHPLLSSPQLQSSPRLPALLPWVALAVSSLV